MSVTQTVTLPLFNSRMTLRGALSLLVVLLAAIPLVFVIYSSLQLDSEGWAGLWSSRLPGLLWNTLSLSVLVGLG
ncbi:MAG: ABC transporter permease, partial [Pseudomonadota bacterium]